jgi:hypothetical protein
VNGVVHRFRDVLYWVDGTTAYVLACDSNAGIGQRPHDALRQPAAETGYSAAKVALMEVLAVGAKPLVLTNALGGPLDDYGQQVLAGINAAVDEIDADVTITGSDETNVPTLQTAVGVTVVGRAQEGSLRLGGTEVGDEDIANLTDVQSASRVDAVHEILPVGSRGVAYEAAKLADGVNGTVRFSTSPIDLYASAGSSTCFLVAVAPAAVEALAPVVRPPVTVIGHIAARN